MAEIAVAPFVGAWIETLQPGAVYHDALSLPSWERGLKQEWVNVGMALKHVAPFVGAWIETELPEPSIDVGNRRSLRGSVD